MTFDRIIQKTLEDWNTICIFHFSDRFVFAWSRFCTHHCQKRSTRVFLAQLYFMHQLSSESIKFWQDGLLKPDLSIWSHTLRAVVITT